MIKNALCCAFLAVIIAICWYAAYPKFEIYQLPNSTFFTRINRITGSIWLVNMADESRRTWLRIR